MKIIKYFSIILIIFCSIAFIKGLFRHTVVVGKSNWPGWDLFEYSQRNQSALSKYVLKFQNYSNYQDIVDAFINQEIDIATVTLFEALIINNKTNRNVTIILLLDYTIGSDAIIAQNNIEYLNQLEGKKIGIEKNTVSYFTLLRALEKANLTKDNIMIKELNQHELIQQFKQNKLNAISLYDPYIFELHEYQKDLNIIFSSKEIPREICDVVIIRKEIINKFPDLVTNIQKKWYDLMSKKLPFQKLKNPLYKNKNYIDHVKSNIYFANENENNYAFGSKESPGYLNNTIHKIGQFLLTENDIDIDSSSQILYIK